MSPIYVEGAGGGASVLHAFPNNIYSGTTVAGGTIPAGTPLGLLLALTYDTDSTGGSSTNVHDFNNDYGRNARYGFIINDGPGKMSVDYSSNGVSYVSVWTMQAGDMFSLDNVSIDTIRISYVATTGAVYRIFLGT